MMCVMTECVRVGGIHSSQGPALTVGGRGGGPTGKCAMTLDLLIYVGVTHLISP